MTQNNILPAILAGGKSRRFGRDKCLEKLGETNLLLHVAKKLLLRFEKILVVVNKNKIKKINNMIVIKDCIKGNQGPLVGILTALKWAKKNNYNWVATFPCDTPFFTNKIINQLIKKTKIKKKKIYYVKSGKQRHNIFSLWPTKCEKILEKKIKIDKIRKVEQLLDIMGSKKILVKNEKNIFLNINTRADFKVAKNKYKNDKLY